MEARSGRAGRREYVEVLRLFETFGTHDVHAAVRHALRLGAFELGRFQIAYGAPVASADGSSEPGRVPLQVAESKVEFYISDDGFPEQGRHIA